MSLKNILRKVTASAIAIYMVAGNLMLMGKGLSEVIAEEVNIPGITIEQAVEKYVKYNRGDYHGVVIQTNIKIGEEANQEKYLPVEKVDLQIQVPKINNYLPERVSMIKEATALTNGKDVSEVSQNYDQNTGLLSLWYENTEDENGNSYQDYKENARDEFEIIYIYPGDAYEKEEQPCEIKQTARVNLGYKTQGNLRTSKENTIKTQETSNRGELTSYAIEKTTNVYKGFMYANEKNKTNYNTDYTTIASLSVMNKEIVDELKVELSENFYMDSEGQEIATDSIHYLSTKIKQDEFYQFFGIDGYVDFYVGQTKYATIHYSMPDEEENRHYTTEYYIINKENIDPGTVEYPEGTNKVTIITSKPQKEGNITVENQKTIIAKRDYGANVSQLEKIKETRNIESKKTDILTTEVKNENDEIVYDENGNIQTKQETKVTQVNKQQNSGNIELKEPTTQMSLELTSNSLSTLSENNLTATIKMNDTNSSCRLLEAGTIEITLPKDVTSAKINSAKSLYTNGISITNAIIRDRKIVLTVKGNQTAYDTENVSGGVTIVLDLTIKMDYRTPSHRETMKMSYQGSVVEKNISIVSKDGLLMAATVSDYADRKTNAVIIDDTNDKLNLEMDSNSKISKTEVNLVNNHPTAITSIAITGILAYHNEAVVSTFKTNLAENIKASKGNVSYSEDGENWVDDYNQNTKYFKVFIDKIEAQEVVTLEVKIIIPEKLGYNEQSYLHYGAEYSCNEEKMMTELKTGFATKETQVVKTISLAKAASIGIVQNTSNALEVTNVVTSGGKIINDEDTVFEGQTLHYTVTVKNNTSAAINHVNMVATIDNSVFYLAKQSTETLGSGRHPTYYVEDSTIENITKMIETLAVGETYQFEYEAVVNQIADGNNTVSTKLIISADNIETIETTRRNVIKEGQLKLNVAYYRNEEDIVYSQSFSAFYITAKNIGQTNLDNIVLQISLPEFLTYDSSEETEANVRVNGTNVYYTINLAKGEEKVIVLPVRTGIIELNQEAVEVSFLATATIDNNTYVSNVIQKTVYQGASGIKISMSSNKASNVVLQNKDSITYIIKLENYSKKNITLDLMDRLPFGLRIQSIEINGQKQYVKNVELLHQTVLINAKTEKIIKIKTILDEDYMQEGQTTLSNYVQVYPEEAEEGYLYSETITHQVKRTVYKESEEEKIDPGEEELNNDDPNTKTYSISGIAWLDKNENGQRDAGENQLEGITVYLYNLSTKKYAVNTDGNQMITQTNQEGTYYFNNLIEGNYVVVTSFNTEIYNVTTYQKSGVNKALNSDFILSNVMIDGNEITGGVTNTINVSSNTSNIDLGLVENAKFDLSLQKQIDEVVVNNSQGTQYHTWNNTNVAKVDLVAKYINTASVIIRYKFIVTNNGTITGYANRLVDNLPNGLEFNSELNKNWYKGTDGSLYTTVLSGTAIAPGESVEVELLLTKQMTENNTGVIENTAQILQISNLYAVKERTESQDNNTSQANLILSIKTGSVWLYLGVTIVSLLIIAVGAYIIKKKVMDSKKEERGNYNDKQ